MANPEYTLEELAELLQMQPRTIRSYIEQGLLRGPDSMGRKARYTDYHLKRLRVVKTLKEDHLLPLSEIRHLMTMAGPDGEIEVAPEEAGAKGSYTEASVSFAPEPPSSAVDYIRARRTLAGNAQRLVQSAKGLPPVQSTRPAGPIEELLVALREQARGRKVPRKVRGQEWIHLEITPDIEIHVRGELSPEQLRNFEHLADLMRHILLGAKDHE